MASPENSADEKSTFRRRFGYGRNSVRDGDPVDSALSRWTLGILNDPKTIEVPGSVILLADRNEPLGMRNYRPRTSHSSLPIGYPLPEGVSTPNIAHPEPAHVPEPKTDEQKRTKDGAIILNPQPEESGNDPLNWPSWRRNLALLCLGFYCMVGGGVTPIIAAGFTNVAEEFDVDKETVALTTGLFMMGLGLGSVFASPTAILFGKRPVYLAGAIFFIITSLWAGWSPTFGSLIAARVFQGFALSPIECLPSATIAEIFFLHERAYRIGIYTLLLLGGKNLVPLVSAVIIGALNWRWTFWIVGIVGGFGAALLFFFVPETFWERTPAPAKKASKRPSFLRRLSSRHGAIATKPPSVTNAHGDAAERSVVSGTPNGPQDTNRAVPDMHEVSSPSNGTILHHGSSTNLDYFANGPALGDEEIAASHLRAPPKAKAYTHNLRQQPPRSFVQQLKPWYGRLNHDNWFKVMFRPFILFAYPAVLWSSMIYACSIGWLIVISEVLAILYRNPDTYNFTALQTGLVYVSPFIGGVLGTGVAGRVSDIIVRAMARRNGGLYEPEFRLIMVIPIALSTTIGLMGFGWSINEQDHWIVPTIFFGIVSFGCSLGSTTAITFCVDSYRQYAGEALVTLNFSKNIFHGLAFSLFVSHWLAGDGPKTVFIWIGIIHLLLCLLTIPMYIFGKKARLWTVKQNLMERF
ncbi:hypothetical protein NLU13_0437 [Sarocladium strictum]|uniref:Major facilitator superfamily (MFS) profile domain-containing protein n=1 Tax=Sarocladium strictum TaxID=5046 RepID=A0AA39LBI0_SARSR|nr:hypothetical protein NLU13_0437 [Sarocladium strictum]